MTPAQYARLEIEAGRLVNMPILDVGGSLYLCDADWHILPGGKAYTDRTTAENERSKIIARALRYIVI